MLHWQRPSWNFMPITLTLYFLYINIITKGRTCLARLGSARLVSLDISYGEGFVKSKQCAFQNPTFTPCLSCILLPPHKVWCPLLTFYLLQLYFKYFIQTHITNSLPFFRPLNIFIFKILFPIINLFFVITPFLFPCVSTYD